MHFTQYQYFMLKYPDHSQDFRDSCKTINEISGTSVFLGQIFLLRNRTFCLTDINRYTRASSQPLSFGPPCVREICSGISLIFQSGWSSGLNVLQFIWQRSCSIEWHSLNCFSFTTAPHDVSWQNLLLGQRGKVAVQFRSLLKVTSALWRHWFSFFFMILSFSARRIK